ncbi:MAG: hypothetical protein KJO82_08495 [Gammaproteobacteria bacterium]|nr:hypothetical protein [Gammaproteobacteria bacterium]
MTFAVAAVRIVTAVSLVTAGAAASGDISGDCHDAVPPFLVATTSWHSTAAVASPPGSVRTREYGVKLGLYRFERKHSRFDFTIDYQYSHLALSGIDSRNRDMHRLSFPLKFAMESNQRLVRGHIAPGIATSSNVFKDFLNRGSGDDLTIAGRIEVGPTVPAGWFVGIAYDQSFGKPRLFPVAGIDMRPRDTLRVRVAFPDSGVWYRVTDRQSLSARLFPSGERWRVVSDDFRTDFHLRREEWRTQMTWSLALGKRVALDVSAGRTFDRRLALTDRAGERINQDVSGEGFAEIGIRLGGRSSR